MKLPRDLREFIVLLNSHDVRYLIVGGYAVAYHGYPRATGDIDLFVEVSRENARKLIAVLGEFGFASLGLGCPVCAHFVHYTSRRNRVPPRRGFRVEVQ
jgi:hypothetical protein